MAEETKRTAPEEVFEVAVSVAEEAPPVEEVLEAEKESKVAESVSFKEESNKVDDLIDREKTALGEFKCLIQEALAKSEFTAPTPSPPHAAVEESKKGEEPEEEKKKENPPKTEAEVESSEPPPPGQTEAVEPVKEEPSEKRDEEKVIPVAEELKETLVHEVPHPAPPPSEEPAAAAEALGEEKEISIWGVPLLADDRSDVVLLKFLRARDFKVKEAFSMLKSVVSWRKDFKIDEVLEEEGFNEGLEKVVYIHGVDKDGHPVCYNAFGEFQNKELYSSTFADAEKRAKFLRWYIQFLEKNVRKLDFNPDGTCTFVQVTDLKNSPGLILLKKELRQATNQALQLLQDNYPEFVAKQVFINVPWWYVAYNRMISPFLTQRTKSKFVFAGPTRTAETLFKYIAPEQVPVQYGGLSKDSGQDFAISDPATEETIKPNFKHTIEFPISEACALVWEVRVPGWDVSYGAEFVPSAEGGYTWIVQKPRKIAPADEQAIAFTFKIGEPGKVVLTLDNPASKKKKVLYRTKTKPFE